MSTICGNIATSDIIVRTNTYTSRIQASYGIDHNQIMHSDRHHRVHFLGGPNVPQKSKMADGSHVIISKNHNICEIDKPILTKFGMVYPMIN